VSEEQGASPIIADGEAVFLLRSASLCAVKGAVVVKDDEPEKPFPREVVVTGRGQQPDHELGRPVAAFAVSCLVFVHTGGAASIRSRRLA
jgi:hypothetical protein